MSTCNTPIGACLQIDPVLPRANSEGAQVRCGSGRHGTSVSSASRGGKCRPMTSSDRLLSTNFSCFVCAWARSPARAGAVNADL